MATKRVLIVDDDQAFAKALAMRCQHLGFDTQVSSEGLHAMMTILQEPPDLVILDVNMPGTDGLRLCEELAKDQRLAPIPVVILTGRSDDATVRRCEDLGAHYVWKGLDTWGQLEPVVRRLLDVPSGPGEQADPPGSAASPAADEPADPTGPKALVIDDDPTISKALKIRLGAYGVQVLRAFNGTQGYWMALKHEPDVIITDINMPEGAGNHLLGRLQGHTITRNIPVIVLTGRRIGGRKDYAMEREMLSYGAKAYLTKPFDFQVLLTELARHIPIPSPTPQTR